VVTFEVIGHDKHISAKHFYDCVPIMVKMATSQPSGGHVLLIASGIMIMMRLWLASPPLIEVSAMPPRFPTRSSGDRRGGLGRGAPTGAECLWRFDYRAGDHRAFQAAAREGAHGDAMVAMACPRWSKRSNATPTAVPLIPRAKAKLSFSDELDNRRHLATEGEPMKTTAEYSGTENHADDRGTSHRY